MRHIIRAVALVAVLAVAAGCGPVEGSGCEKRGDVYAHGGVTLKCGTDHKWHK